MAIWQFQCFIIPFRKNADKLGKDEMISWKNVEKPLMYPDFLKCEKSWSIDIVQYGHIDKTCIEFIYDKGKLEEINCRLDLRTLTKHNLACIVEYVQSIEALKQDLLTFIHFLREKKYWLIMRRTIQEKHYFYGLM